MLGAFLESGKSANGRPAILEGRIMDVEEERKIALDDERFTFGHIR